MTRDDLILDFLSNPSLNLRNSLREILNARTQQVKVGAAASMGDIERGRMQISILLLVLPQSDRYQLFLTAPM